MPASKDDIVRTIRESQREIEKVASSLPDTAWSRGVYEQGWNAKQLLSHLAADSGVPGFLINMANVPAGFGSESDFDLDAFNEQQVAARQDKTVSELLEERRIGSERQVTLVQAAPDDLLAHAIRAPWGDEGPLADVIVRAVEGHVGMHLADLRAAAG